MIAIADTALPVTAPPASGRRTQVGVVVVAGGSSGIGRATVAAFAREGWRVGIVARGEAGLRAARDDVEQLGAVAATAVADVADGDALERAASEIERALGPVDVWVNCAGNATFGRFLDTPADEYRRVTDVTYLGTVNFTRTALARMLPRDRGCVVNVCSAVAFQGMPLLSSYCGAKHAVRGFCQSVRAELVQERSRVRLVAMFPPAVSTPFFDHAPSHMGRPGRPIPPVHPPEVIAGAIVRAARTGHGEVTVTATAGVFALAARIVPGLVRRAVARLGYGGQLTDDPAALARHAPTLFAPSDCASPVHGAFASTRRSGRTRHSVGTVPLR